ncbi:SRPBCC family protein [Cellulomonas massiliensis]|uniref:SRPBCC family protein n=1 Tax=Cellulomonas massiliensis TaxID=1465811 RepID=UPI0002E1075B|nr:SRPBCC family protein [Cellulomonas massiliensis]
MTLIFDLLPELEAIRRDVRPGDGTVVVSLTRTYDAQPADVWDALTTPDRLARWFAPVSGDLREGGTFQIHGNAGGEIRRCEPPASLSLTFGGPDSIVDLRLTPEGDRTTLVLAHEVPLAMAGSGAGALYPGPGWDGAFLGLAIHLRGGVIGDPFEAANTPEVIEFNAGSIDRWTAAVEASGTATPEQVAEARAVAIQQYTVLPEA